MFPPDGGKKPRRWLAPCWSCLEAADVGVGDMNIPWAWRALERCLGVGIIFFVRAEFSTERFDTCDTLLDSIGWSPIWKHQVESIWWVSAVIWWCFNKFPLNRFLVPDSAGWFAGGQNHLFAGSECQHPVKITIFSWFIQLLPVKIIGDLPGPMFSDGRRLVEPRSLADVSRTNSDGGAPLHVAAWSGQLPMPLAPGVEGPSGVAPRCRDEFIWGPYNRNRIFVGNVNPGLWLFGEYPPN